MDHRQKAEMLEQCLKEVHAATLLLTAASERYRAIAELETGDGAPEAPSVPESPTEASRGRKLIESMQTFGDGVDEDDD